MTPRRKKITAAGAEELLDETLTASLQVRMIKPADLQRVMVDSR
jgi:hypothetical protein